jgi:8-oxo-dGTP diphosphatase
MIEVTCAIIRNDEGKVLVVRRGPDISNAGKWEFPGGKIKSGETQEDCIIREIHEELGIDIILSGSLEPVEHDYGDKYIKLYPFICDTLATKLIFSEHDDHRWLRPEELMEVNFSDADVPVARDYASRNLTITEENSSDVETVSMVEAGEEMARVIGRITSTREISMIARSAVSDTILLSQLVTLSRSSEKRVGFMASWALSKVVDIDPSATIPFLPAIIDALPDIDNESVQRSFLRVLTKNDMNSIPLSYHGKLVDYCFKQLRSGVAAVAPKAYSMDILGKMCDIYPEMKGEVASTINIMVSDSSAGVKSQARKLISKLLNSGE